MSVMRRIEDFLGQQRLAMAGVSRKADDFSRALFRELCRRGYEVVPVNPGATEIEGRPCFARLTDIQPPVETVLLMTPAAAASGLVRECAALGVRRVWMYRAAGQGAVSRESVEFCEANGIQVIPGECPFMFLPNAGWVHRLHGGLRKLTRTYPR